jgi:hypothetical protein
VLVDELAVTAAGDPKDLRRLETTLDFAFGLDHDVAAPTRSSRHGALVAMPEHL